MLVRVQAMVAELFGMSAGAVALLMGTAVATVTVMVADIVTAIVGDTRMQLPLSLWVRGFMGRQLIPTLLP